MGLLVLAFGVDDREVCLRQVDRPCHRLGFVRWLWPRLSVPLRLSQPAVDTETHVVLLGRRAHRAKPVAIEHVAAADRFGGDPP